MTDDLIQRITAVARAVTITPEMLGLALPDVRDVLRGDAPTGLFEYAVRSAYPEETMVSDLDERVRTRIEAWARLSTAPEDVQDAFDRFVVDVMVASWRERWKRHRPLPGVAVCGTCAHPMDRPPGGPPVGDEHLDLCDDAVAICREIGVGI